MQKVYEQFIVGLSESVDERDLERAMINLLSAFDLRNFAYLQGPCGPEVISSVRYVSNYPSDWVDHYLREEYQRIDPIVALAVQSSEPFCWSKNLLDQHWSSAQNRFFDEAAEFGITSGLTVPIHDLRGGRAALTMATDDRSPGLSKLVDRYARAFQLIATSYHIHARRLLSSSNTVDGVQMTPREFECLQWAAKGKSAWEIGEILGITRRTAAFHLDNARSKLGVRTVTQAVALMASSASRRSK